ncbi:hypothetical protein [Silvanigrella aquatica]|uniref:PilZ domain-containing protein n=1 Tax=Silvanigrella aquatica TaxID=1915309 RepID=A0A1L4D048_9BACT|nr:hypothetical protein [Silvanigrella aquatica]APJ03560.1 hypothetical protein AXG55_06420 [Silvanigrella aquatica]
MLPKIPKRKEPRYETAIVADVFIKKWNPIAKKKVVVLDLSWHGFKIEFMNEKTWDVKSGATFTIRIPITQFNISTLKYLKLEIIVKWCDKELKRAGGIFVHPKGEKAIVLGNLIQKLAILKQTEDDIVDGSTTEQSSVNNEEAS